MYPLAKAKQSKSEKDQVEQKDEELERFLYPSVRKYFSDKLNCEIVGSANGSSISLSVFGGRIIPDVYGIKDPKSSDFKIFMAEGKLDFTGRDFDICKGQAISLQRFADFTYLFFPREAWDRLQEREHEDILTECENLKLGLLIVNREECQELKSPHRNEDVLDENKRSSAKSLIIDYFPDFTGPEDNTRFFKRFTELALNIAGECYSILEDECKVAFKEISKAKQVSLRVYDDMEDGYFQFYIRDKLVPCQVWVTTNPFGHPIAGINEPILVLEQHFYENYLRKGISERFLDYLFGSSKEGSKIELHTNDKQIVLERPEEVVKFVNRFGKALEKVSIYKAIKLIGQEKEIIKRETKNTLKKMYAQA